MTKKTTKPKPNPKKKNPKKKNPKRRRDLMEPSVSLVATINQLFLSTPGLPLQLAIVLI